MTNPSSSIQRRQRSLDRSAAEQMQPGRLDPVVGLRFYRRWTRKQIAKLCGVDERTVRGRSESALVRDRASSHERQ
jgi:hypothetical protein